MAFSIKEILSSMRDSFSPFDQGTGQFLSLNIENVKSELKLAERSAENAEKNIPRKNTKTKDTIAIEIDSYLSAIIASAKEKVIDHLKAINELSSTQSSINPQIITELYEGAKSELKTAARDFYNNLFSLRRKWVRGENELNLFREKNNLIGPARYPTNRQSTYGIIFLIFVIEILTNAYALGTTHPDGPIGVVIEIFMFGIANVGVSFLLGFYLLRQFNHISMFRKLVSLVITLPGFGFLIFLNFLLAHYRDALSQIDPSQSLAVMISSVQELGSVAANNLFSNPIGLNDFKSFLLLFVGLLASIFALKKSYDLDDPYPGYGKLERFQDKIAVEFNDEQNFAFEELNGMVEEYSKDINGQLESYKGGEKAIIFREQDIINLDQKYNAWLISIKNAGEALYSFYRDENIKNRKINEEPKTFQLHSYIFPENTKLDIIPKKATLTDIKSIENLSKKYLKDLNKLSRDYQNKFKDIEKLSSDKVLNSNNNMPTIFRD